MAAHAHEHIRELLSMTIAEQSDSDQQDEDLIEMVPCVVCGRPFDPEEMNLPDEGWMCESCFDEKYPG